MRLRRVLRLFGTWFTDAWDRRYGRLVQRLGRFRVDVTALERLIDERVRCDDTGAAIAPEVMQLTLDWATHSTTAPAERERLERDLLVTAIDYINDQRYLTLAPVQVKTKVDIFADAIKVEPTFSNLAELPESEFSKLNETTQADLTAPYRYVAQVTKAEKSYETTFLLAPGQRMSVGNSPDNDFTLNDGSVSAIHAVVRLTRAGKLVVADTGSAHGTYVKGGRVCGGQMREIKNGRVRFGEVNVRLRRLARPHVRKTIWASSGEFKT